MNYSELLKNRRSIRHYKEKQVSTELLKEIITESTLSPSSGNNQYWKFIIVNDATMMKRISDDSKKNLLARIKGNPNDYAVKYQNALKRDDFNVFYNAPALVIIIGPTNYKNLFVDCALCAAYFMNAAVVRGLGTCWVNLGAVIKDTQILAELGMPEDYTIVAPIIIGYPETIPHEPLRKEPDIIRIID